MDHKLKEYLANYPAPVQDSVRDAVEQQQNFYELSSDWNYYTENEHEYLKKNIRYSIFGTEDTNDAEASDGMKNQADNDKKDHLVDHLYDCIIKASRSKKSIYVGVIFHILCNIDGKEKYMCPIPIFKVKRCETSPSSLSDKKCNKLSKNQQDKQIGKKELYPNCVHYVDIEGRIYKNWTDYVKNNTVPKGMMVLPMGGFYQANPKHFSTTEKSYVWVEVGPSATNQIPVVLDAASSVLGMGALGVGLATLALPVAAPIAIAGTICGAVTGVYASARSIGQLVDRRKHKQSISPDDASARSAWIGIAGAVAGGAASGSTFILGRAVRAGVTLGTASRVTYNAITVGSVLINGAGIGNGIYDMYTNYQRTKEIQVGQVIQVVAHVLFFGNTVMNFQTAKSLIQSTQQQELQNYENSLRSNRHRKAFQAIKRSTHASNSDSITADTEIIRGIRSINNKDEFFAGVVKNRKVFSQTKSKITFKDGKATINNNMEFDPNKFFQLSKETMRNTVMEAKPFQNKVSNNFKTPNQMPSVTYNIEIERIRNILSATVEFVKNFEKSPLGELIIELSDFSDERRTDIILALTKFAQRVIKEDRKKNCPTIEELMYFTWKEFIVPQINQALETMGRNASEEPWLAIESVIFSIIKEAINGLYNNIEKFLEEIIESRPTPTKVGKTCDICSGYMLSD